MTLQTRTTNDWWTPLSDNHKERLAHLGMSVDTFWWWVHRFVTRAFDYVIKRGTDDWSFQHRKLTLRDLFLHLEGHHILGVGYPRLAGSSVEVADYFIVDLDAGRDLERRVYQLSLALGSPLLFQSSRSGGAHGVYFLSEPVEALELYNPVNADGILPRLLSEGGLEIQQGVVEILPEGSYIGTDGQRRPGQRARLPGGRGSVLLDPEERSPLSTEGAGAIVRAHALWESGYVEALDVAKLRAESASMGRRGRPKLTARRGSGRLASARGDLVWRYDFIGLERGGELNEAALVKGVEYALQQVPLPQALELAAQWLEAKHNGHSKTYNEQGAEAAHTKVAQTIRWVYKTFRKGMRIPRPGLTTLDMASIHAATEGHGAELPDPSTGELFARLKVEQFLVDLVRGMKQWVLHKCLVAAERVANANPKVPLGSPKFTKLFLGAVRRFWPCPPAPLFIVDSPYAFRRKIKGVGEGSLAAIWRIALGTGLFRRHRRHHQYTGQCEAYAVRLDFAPNDFGTVNTMAEALITMLPPGELRASYGRDRANRIQKRGKEEVAARLKTREPHAIREYVAQRLTGACEVCAQKAAGRDTVDTSPRNPDVPPSGADDAQ